MGIREKLSVVRAAWNEHSKNKDFAIAQHEATGNIYGTLQGPGIFVSIEIRTNKLNVTRDTFKSLSEATTRAATHNWKAGKSEMVTVPLISIPVSGIRNGGLAASEEDRHLLLFKNEIKEPLGEPEPELVVVSVEDAPEPTTL